MALGASAPALHAVQEGKKQTMREWFVSLFKAPQKREEQLFTPAQKTAQQAARSRWFGTRPAIYSASHPYLQWLGQLGE